MLSNALHCLLGLAVFPLLAVVALVFRLLFHATVSPIDSVIYYWQTPRRRYRIKHAGLFRESLIGAVLSDFRINVGNAWTDSLDMALMPLEEWDR